MATTTTWSITYPTTANNITPLATHFANLANSTDTSLTNLQNKVGSFRGLNVAKGAAGQEGRRYYATDTDALYFDNGTSWIAYYNAFTPSWTGLTLGDGTTGGYYWRNLNKVELFAWFRMSTTSAITGGLKLTLPVAPSISITTPANGEAIGSATVNRSGVFFGPIMPILNSETAPQVEFLALSVGGTYASYSAISSSVPGTWGTTTGFSTRITYRID